jgi:glycosyltransferase involved in cell wall biosynthesis
MKLLVFAHTPPPHHGQSYMVQLMVEGFGGDRRKARRQGAIKSSEGQPSSASFSIECYHVNARLSRKLEEIGDLRIGKFFLLLGYCLQAIWCRFRYGVTTFYYIPAPGKRSALYRDWVVMLICRMFFKRIILHWHAAGLAKWLEMVVGMRCRSITYSLMKRVDLSIVLSKFNRADAEKIFSRHIRVVSNGIPDPCPRFVRDVLPRRRARHAARAKLMTGQTVEGEDLNDTGGDPHVVKILYLAHCTREKGLFDTLTAASLLYQSLVASRSPLSIRLLVAGGFVTSEEEADFKRIMTQPDMPGMVHYFGFVSGEQKGLLLRDADLFCFPTYFQNENQPVNLIEAMAFGLPVLTTRWRSLPELFPADYPGLVNVRSPQQIAEVLLSLMARESGEGFRDIFLRNFTLERHLTGLAEAFLHSEQSGQSAVPIPALGTVQK